MQWKYLRGMLEVRLVSLLQYSTLNLLLSLVINIPLVSPLLPPDTTHHHLSCGLLEESLSWFPRDSFVMPWVTDIKAYIMPFAM